MNLIHLCEPSMWSMIVWFIEPCNLTIGTGPISVKWIIIVENIHANIEVQVWWDQRGRPHHQYICPHINSWSCMSASFSYWGRVGPQHRPPDRQQSAGHGQMSDTGQEWKHSLDRQGWRRQRPAGDLTWDRPAGDQTWDRHETDWLET